MHFSKKMRKAQNQGQAPLLLPLSLAHAATRKQVGPFNVFLVYDDSIIKKVSAGPESKQTHCAQSMLVFFEDSAP